MGQQVSTTRRPSLLRAVLTTGAAVTVLSLTGAPTPKTLARLTDAGVAAETGVLLLHIAPIVLAMVGIAAGLLISRGRGALTRGVILAVAGGFIGFFMAFCIDLFIGVLPALEQVTGPLREATGLDVAAWSLAALTIIYGVMTIAVAQFGTPALEAINFENVDPECIEVRPRDRGMFARAAVGLIGQGVFVGALAVLHQLGPEAGGAMRGGAVVVLVLGVLAAVWSSWVIWKSMDELLRRTVIESYAWSGFLATVGGLVWAVLEALKITPPLSAYAVIVVLLFIQTMTAMLITAGFGSPAAVRKGAR
jgi:hypothetical protein